MVSQLESGGLPRDGDPGKWGGAHTDVHGGSPVVMLSICVLSHLSPKVFSSRRGLFFFFFFTKYMYQIHPEVGTTNHCYIKSSLFSLCAKFWVLGVLPQVQLPSLL